MPSFDIVSQLDTHELTNAIDNATKELVRRYDLKDQCSIEYKDKIIKITTEAEFQLDQVVEIIKMSFTKRKLDIRCLDIEQFFASGKLLKQEIKLKEGIDKTISKKITSSIKDSKLKVQASIQGDSVRVTGKKRDDLQEVIEFLKNANFEIPLQFNNFRD